MSVVTRLSPVDIYWALTIRQTLQHCACVISSDLPILLKTTLTPTGCTGNHGSDRLGNLSRDTQLRSRGSPQIQVHFTFLRPLLYCSTIGKDAASLISCWWECKVVEKPTVGNAVVASKITYALVLRPRCTLTPRNPSQRYSGKNATCCTYKATHFGKICNCRCGKAA